MYRLVNEYRTAIYEVETEKERDELLSRGYTEEKPTKSSSKRGKKNDKTEN